MGYFVTVTSVPHIPRMAFFKVPLHALKRTGALMSGFFCCYKKGGCRRLHADVTTVLPGKPAITTEILLTVCGARKAAMERDVP